MTWVTLYTFLALLRGFIAFLPGYVHPDEFFQSTEVVSRDILGYSHLHIPWEFDAAFPCRSIVPPYIITGIPVTIANALGASISGVSLYYMTRVTMVILSFVLDLAVYRICERFAWSPRGPLLTLASSNAMLTFHTRTFSNTTESLLLALGLWVFFTIPGHYTGRDRTLSFRLRNSLLAGITALGIFTRFTYIFYAFPLVIYCAYQCVAIGKHSIISRILTPVFAFIAVSGCVITVDSLYFRDTTITAWNSLVYNSDPRNLALHGIHARWTHAVVNMPVTFNLLAIASGGSLARYLYTTYIQPSHDTAAVKVSTLPSVPSAVMHPSRASALLAAVPLSGLFFLSLAPHQEARFLAPMLAPLCILCGHLFFPRPSPQSGRHRVRTVIVTVWLAVNLAAALFFGGAHQSGVVPASGHVSHWLAQERMMHTDPLVDPPTPQCDVQVLYWRTYMPPRFILQIPGSAQGREDDHIVVRDIGRLSDRELIHVVHAIPKHCRATTKIIAPHSRMTAALARDLNLVTEWHYPWHISTEDLPRSRDEMGLGVFKLGPVKK